MGYESITNEFVLQKIKEHKKDFLEKYIQRDMSKHDKVLVLKFLEMGEDITLKVLLEFTVPVSRQLYENTRFLKKIIIWGGTVASIVISSLIISLINVILK